MIHRIEENPDLTLSYSGNSVDKKMAIQIRLESTGESINGVGSSLGEMKLDSLLSSWAFQVVQRLKHLPAMRETWV